MLKSGEKLGSFIVPTGVGASIGGFAGDASVYARKLSKKCRLIVNPNVVNAACFSGINDKMLYVEGYSLDEFFRGKCKLIPASSNKVGVVFDKSISRNVLNVHLNTINAVKIVYGVDVVGCEITSESAGVEFYVDDSGVSTGNVKNLETIKFAAEKLIKAGADAIAVVCAFPEDESEGYANGVGVDHVGGVEAIISHYISRELKVPSAHAPAFENLQISTDIVDSRCSAEYITPTFLPCILLGLAQAPRLSDNEGISVNDLDFLVMPFNSLGGVPVLEMQKLGKPIYAIKENKTVLNITGEKLAVNCTVLDSYDDLFELIRI